MKENFLHHIWLHKNINVTQLFTTKGDKIEILQFGQYLQTAGPDFFNAQLIIGNQRWAGNIEIHVKSSDWYLHHHQTDSNYDNVILHVVWEHDIDVYHKNNDAIPVLELKNYVSADDISKYEALIRPKTWINCENSINKTPVFILNNWLERLFFERLEQKSKIIEELLQTSQNDWEVVFYCLLFKSFGLNRNGDVFLEIAKQLPFSIVRKERHNLKHLEALFLGAANLLQENKEDVYYKELQDSWIYLQHKYQLKINIEPVQFFKLRPDNFPTIRLVQLATLFHTNSNLFSNCISSFDIKNFYAIFSIKHSSYWNSHYTFDKVSFSKKKRLTNQFVDLLVINTIVPMQFTYANFLGIDKTAILLKIISQIPPENNVIIQNFKTLGISIESAFDTQALLQLKKSYCSLNKCLQCAIGITILKK